MEKRRENAHSVAFSPHTPHHRTQTQDKPHQPHTEHKNTTELAEYSKRRWSENEVAESRETSNTHPCSIVTHDHSVALRVHDERVALGTGEQK